LLGIRASSLSKNAYAKPDLRSSAPQTVKGAAARLASLGPDGPPLTGLAALRFGAAKGCADAQPLDEQGVLPFCGGRTPRLDDPERSRGAFCPAPGVLGR
jgi:hypothetical protein